jgi:hypothetical protein
MRGTGQILQFPLARGLDQDANEKGKPMAALKTGRNIRWPRDGAIGKRYGCWRFPSEELSNPYRFLVRGSELAVVKTNGGVVVWDPVVSAWRDEDSTSLPPIQLDWSVLSDDEQGVAHADIAVYGDYLIHAWVTGDPSRAMHNTPVPDASGDGVAGTGGTAFVQVRNWRTGQIAISPAMMMTTSVRQVRICVSGLYAFVFFSEGNNINYYPIDLTALEYVAPSGADEIVTNLTTDTPSESYQGVFDAITLASGDICIVYEDNGSGEGSGVTAIRVTRSAQDLSIAASSEHADHSLTCISIVEQAVEDRVYILYGHTDDTPDSRVRLRAVDNSTMAEDLAASTVHDNFIATACAAAVPFGDGVVGVWSGQNNDDVGLATQLVSEVFGSSGSASGFPYKSSGIELVSRVFELGTKICFFAVDATTAVSAGTDEQRPTSISSYLLELGFSGYSQSVESQTEPPHGYLGKIDHDIAARFQNGIVPQVIAIDEETALAILPYQATAAQSFFNWRTGTRIVRATSDRDLFGDWGNAICLGQEAYVSGSRLSAWDGRIAFDYGMRQPILLATTQGNASTGNISNGGGTRIYGYQLQTGFRSFAGILHRSPMSQPSEAFVTNANTSVEVRLCPNAIDGKQTIETGFGEAAAGSTFYDTFRTEANGANYHKLTYEPRYNTRINRVVGGDSMLITDRAADEDVTRQGFNVALDSRPQPYTASSELEDCQPPAPWTIHVHGRRIFIVTGLRREIWFSKDYTENGLGVAPGFNPLQVELYDEDITGLASLDDKRIIFWERGLWYVQGDGPTVAGTDNRFSAPQPIQSDVGCTNPWSIVSTPMGVIFQSEADLYVLGRNLTVDWAGKLCRDVLASYPVVTSAVLVSDQNEVRFTCLNEDEDAGLMLVLDYVRNTWSTREYADGAPILDACVFDGVYHFLTDEHVYREDITSHLDDVDGTDSYVTSTVELESISPAGAIGWQRVRIAKMLGQSLSNHAMTISAARDWATSYEQSEAFAAGSAYTTPGSHARAEIMLTVQRRQAIQIKLEDAAPANTTAYPLGNGAGFLLEGIALLVQPKPGLPRDLSTRRGG